MPKHVRPPTLRNTDTGLVGFDGRPAETDQEMFDFGFGFSHLIM